MSSETSSKLSPETSEPDPRRWRALSVLALIQFILVLDITIVNVALPRIREELGFSRAGLAWVVNGYVLMAGGLLLLGGRLADIFGRRRLFLAGVAVFALSSAAAGAAFLPGMLVADRFGQGLGEALAAPAALGLIALLFTDPQERVKALGIWGGLTGLGGAMGMILSGLLTDLASWRVIFYINVPVTLLVLVLVPRLVTESRMVRNQGRIDYTGAITATLGLVALVYGLLSAADHAWDSWRVLAPLLGGLALLALTAVVELRSASPVIPLRFFRNRTRVVANTTALVFSAGFFAYTFLLTLFVQEVRHFSPLKAGLLYLPLSLGMAFGIGVSTALMPKLGVKGLLAIGYSGGAVGLFVASTISPDSSYLGGVLPGMLLVGIFSGICFPAGTSAALHEVTVQDSSLGSAVQNAMTQIGGAIGLAALVTLAIRHAGSETATGVAPDAAITGGYVLAFRIGAVLLAICAVMVLALLGKVSPPRSTHR